MDEKSIEFSPLFLKASDAGTAGCHKKVVPIITDRSRCGYKNLHFPSCNFRTEMLKYKQERRKPC
jgi:hypothetical protein